MKKFTKLTAATLLVSIFFNTLTASAAPLLGGSDLTAFVIWTSTTPTYGNDTADANSAGGAGDVSFFSFGSGEKVYFGLNDITFDKIYIDVSTGGDGSIYTFIWGYWNGGTWSPLTMSESNCGATTSDVLNTTGTKTCSLSSVPGDWAETEIHASEAPGTYYYVRLECGGCNFDTTLAIDQISVRSTGGNPVPEFSTPIYLLVLGVTIFMVAKTTLGKKIKTA